MTAVGMVLAGALGAWARYELAGWIQARAGTALTLGTAVVNLTGTVVFAALVAAQHAGVLSSGWVTVLGTGFAGAFTTFSTWMVESVHVAGGRVGLRVAAVNLGGQLLAGSAVAGVILALA
ncbi:MAG TPA: CrcB family protein [Egibacteraceae bacterium]|jgi:fluoride exporter|nr:CrcB family protein [Egibacteraceae bacterium]